MNKLKIIFVYNADSDPLSQILDFGHKIISPQTYQCNLCKLTHGNIKIKNEWKEFLQNFQHDFEFLHKDEFAKKYPILATDLLPAIYIKKDEKIELLFDNNKVNNIQTTQDLINLLNETLA